MDQNNYFPQQDPAQQPQYPQQIQDPQQPWYQQSYQPQKQQPVPNTPQPNLLVYGILSLCLCIIVGICLGVAGRKRGNAYIAQGGRLTGASKAGYIMCKIGFIVSIVVTVIMINVFFVVVRDAMY